MQQQVKAETKVIKSQTICHVCHATAFQELWRRGDKLFETVICRTCGVERGRINSGAWHVIKSLEGANESGAIHTV